MEGALSAEETARKLDELATRIESHLKQDERPIWLHWPDVEELKSAAARMRELELARQNMSRSLGAAIGLPAGGKE